MKRQIVIEIDCEDERCRDKCEGFSGCGCYRVETGKIAQTPGGFGYKESVKMRGPLCKEAERKLTALIEAGQALADEIILQEPDWSKAEAWDAAVREVRE